MLLGSKVKLLTIMFSIGIIYGLVFHYFFMSYFLNSVLHCILMGALFGLLNFFVAQNFYVKFNLLKENNKHLNIEVKRDKLTDLLNRRAFDNDLHKLDSCERYSLLFIDIDNFRNFNNKYGHKIGDMVLAKTAAKIKDSIRPGDFVYRYGGEEIVVFLNNCERKCAFRIAERIRENISNINNSQYPPITVSIGISSYPKDGKNIKEIIEKSDAALISAKNSGKNCVFTA